LLEHVVRELALLRSCILRLWRIEYPSVSVDDAEVLAGVVERAIERSVSRYFEQRSQLLTAMEEIAEVAFAFERFDDFLDGLLRIFMRFAPTMDSAAILLREGDNVTVRAAIGLEEEVRRRVTLRIGEGFAGTIAETRKPLFLSRAWEDPLLQSDVIRARKTLALYGVPLSMGDELVGVAHIGSSVSEMISEADKRVFRALAQRATSAIVKYQLRARVQRATAEFRAVMEAIPSPAFVGDTSALRIANAAGLHMLGYRDEAAMTQASLEEVTKRAQVRDPKTGEMLLFVDTPYGRAIRGETTVREMIHVIEGEERIMRGHAGPITVGGATVGAAIVLMDVTELHRAVDELERTAAFRERFVGIVSHDLRNPLNAIAMSAGILLRSNELPASLAKPVGRIFSNVDRMAKMIGDLLDFTRGRLGGGIPVVPQPGTNLATVVEHVLEELEQTHPDRHVEWRTHGDTRGEWDPARLAQVVANLLVNAMQYGAQGEPVRVEIAGRRDTVTLQVHNAGVPIPKDALPYVFDPFRRAKQGDLSPAGLGLGLFIASEITRAHGGRIVVASDDGGTMFTVDLPRTTPGK
jgi:signal transduction histidine kinase